MLLSYDVLGCDIITATSVKEGMIIPFTLTILLVSTFSIVRYDIYQKSCSTTDHLLCRPSVRNILKLKEGFNLKAEQTPNFQDITY